MKHKTRNLPHTVSNILKQINKSHDMATFLHYETIIIGYVISLVGIALTVANLIICVMLHNSIKITFITTSVMAVSSFAVWLISAMDIPQKLKSHLISILSLILFYTVILPNLSIANGFIWNIIFVVMIFAVLRMEYSIFIYICVSAIGISLYLFASHYGTKESIFYIFQSIIFVLTFIIGIVTHRLYKDLVLTNFSYIEKLENYTNKIKEDEKELFYMANYDTLTCLPNRKMFMEILEELCRENQPKFAVVFIDLDNFKKINDTMGHYVGDLYLKEIGERFSKLVNDGDVLGRIGGDEFAMIIRQYHDCEYLIEYVRKFKESFHNCFEIDQYTFKTSASFGISLYPQDAENAVEILKAADTALYRVKEHGKNDIAFFNGNIHN
ncbi:GGDEF domain-containing protein [Clostridium tyrobutyricum]|uniref:GGDEF domain-containing protein n=1 Tax=Clostridium tyrobutyricum TaxID=1519 RepID=UPI00057F529A|nr:GGDEF domain-containing protein [Clostridium tyrobutyricum]